MATDRVKAQEARELYELKQRAMVYYTENGVPQKIEEILNSTFYDNPNDVYGHLANFFEKYSCVPTITKLKGIEACDSKGQPAVLTEVYCMTKNFEKLIVSTVSNSENSSVDIYAMKPEEREQVEMERQKQLAAMIDFIQNSINSSLYGLDPAIQDEIDSEIVRVFNKIRKKEDEKAKEQEDANDAAELLSVVETKPESVSPSKGAKPKSPKGKGGKGKEVVIIPDEPKEPMICGCSSVSVVSQALCQTAAILKDIPLYQHISSLRFDEVPVQFRLPLPMATILSCGKNMPGKLNCVKEYMVVPKPGMPFKEAYNHIRKIYQHCTQVLSGKTGAISRNVNELGALCPTYDKPEQGLDLLQDAITSAGLTPGEDFHIALNCAGPEIFDYVPEPKDGGKEKGKYEVVTGGLKGAEDLADYWGDILNRYHSIIALIDPMRNVEKEAWMKLCERVTERCYIVGEETIKRPGKLKNQEITPDFKTSGVVFKVDGMNTISDILDCGKKMEDCENQVIVSANGGECGDTFIVDLALGMNAKFLKLGAPNRGERIAKYNHLLQLESQLEELGKLAHWDPHTFPFIKPPTPLPEEDEEVEAASPNKDKK